MPILSRVDQIAACGLFNNCYKNRKVLVTGHTGFKGSWACHWLSSMGAQVTGIALAPSTTPSHFALYPPNMHAYEADIRKQNELDEILALIQPEIVFHLAAQPLVHMAYDSPIETFDVNVMGSLKVMEACRKAGSVKAIVMVTTDKVYENNESGLAFHESDRLGAHDPYSASKAAMEIAVASFTQSFFQLQHLMGRSRSHAHARAMLSAAATGELIV